MESETQTNKNKSKTHRYRDHIGGYQREKGLGEVEMGEGDQLYGAVWYLDLE